MKNAILGFLIAIVLIGTIATTAPNQLLTVKPKTPKQIFCKTYHRVEYARDEIKSLTTKGWVVKTVSTSSTMHGIETPTILIMERY